MAESATELSWNTLGQEDFLDGEMGVATGMVKEWHPVPTGLAPWFPIWGSLGGGCKASCEGGFPCHLQSLETPDGHCTLTVGQASTGYVQHHLSLLWIGLYQPTVLVQALPGDGSCTGIIHAPD